MVEPPLAQDAVVLRFPPGGADQVEQIRKEAKWVHRHHNREREEEEPNFRLSVFADLPRPGERRVDLLRRLVAAAGLANITIESERNSACWTSTAGALYENGFRLVKDGYPGEPREHYSVDLGTDVPSKDLIRRFVGLFDRPQETQELR